MEPKVNFFIEDTPFNYERALTLKTGVEMGKDGEVNVFLEAQKAAFAMAFIGQFIDVEVYYKGQKIEVEF